MQITTSQTRVCPFCAETILAAAVKCRYCGEFLNTARAKALVGEIEQPVRRATLAQGGQIVSADEQQADDSAGFARSGDDKSRNGPIKPDEIIYRGRPTLWAMTMDFAKGGGIIFAALIALIWRIERIWWLGFRPQTMAMLAKYRWMLGLGTILVMGAILFYKAWKVRMTHYEVSPDRIEYGEGILDRRVDNLDMFRVVDIKLRRTVIDLLVGVGTVTLTTTDKSHPTFEFKKIKNSRELYDLVKKAALSADRRTNVVHME